MPNISVIKFIIISAIQFTTGVIIYDGNSFAKIRVDIDGPNKGQNLAGYDLFDFNILLTTKQLEPSICNDGRCSESLSGPYLTAWVIRNGNMDYKKCNDLNWETKTSCK